ncbi:hypothetical protein DVA76_19340, partial [Acinetobacter baumannii]
DQLGSSEHKITSVTTTVFNTTPLPSHPHENCRNANLCDGLSSEKSKKVPKSKQVSDKVNKIVLREQPAHLPASNRLMTRALKA